MTSAVGGAWLSRFDAPAKAAVRWAWAMAVARQGPGTAAIHAEDLLAGILLADPRGSPARELLNHYDIPVGAVVRRDLGRPPSVGELTAALEHVPADQLPPDKWLVDVVDRMLADPPTDNLISLRELFGVMLPDLLKQLTEQLERRGIDGDQLVRSYADYLGGRATYGEFLRKRFPYRPRNIELPSLLADQPGARRRAAPPDLVGINAEVAAFAYLIASTRLTPPLAVGLFGDWGSGKSYFLRSLQRRIDRVAREAPAGPQGTERMFHRHVVQIEFNAWQYVGGDLWASLLEHLFRNLRRAGDDSADLLAQRQHYWIRKVQGATSARVEAELKRTELEAQRDAAQQEVDERRQELTAHQRQARARWLPSRELRERIGAAAGVEVVGQHAEELAGELDQAREALRGLGSVLAPLRARERRYQLEVGLLVALPIAVTVVMAVANPAAVATLASTVTAWLVAVVGYLRVATKVVSDTTTLIRDAEAELDNSQREQNAELAGEVEEAERRLDDAQSKLDAAVTAERELAAAADEVMAELAATTPRRVLNEFIADRLASEDYRRHLGVPAIVRRDLERLSQLVAEQRDDDPVPDEYAIDRIVLYIDDLDRCPTELVVKVLEAVHLLLAFPLFVVVVAVDSRWLTHSLTEYYSHLRGRDATPENYLEKIFQVPFWVLPVGTDVRKQILRGLLLPNLTSSAPEPGADGGTDPDGMPSAQSPEFNELVRSFAVTDPDEQAWRAVTGLTVTGDELRAIESMADLIGATPRAAKRFVNIYLLTKAMGVNKGLTLPPDGQLALLLAVNIGLPSVAEELFAGLVANPNLPLSAMVTTSPDTARFTRWLAAHPEHQAEYHMSGVADWVGLITRFRFTAG